MTAPVLRAVSGLCCQVNFVWALLLPYGFQKTRGGKSRYGMGRARAGVLHLFVNGHQPLLIVATFTHVRFKSLFYVSSPNSCHFWQCCLLCELHHSAAAGTAGQLIWYSWPAWLCSTLVCSRSAQRSSAGGAMYIYCFVTAYCRL